MYSILKGAAPSHTILHRRKLNFVESPLSSYATYSSKIAEISYREITVSVVTSQNTVKPNSRTGPWIQSHSPEEYHLSRRAFFLVNHYLHATYLEHGTVRFLSAVRAVTARCKPHFALRPGLSQEDVIRTKEITKENKPSGREGQTKETKESAVFPLILSCRRHEVRRGQDQW